MERAIDERMLQNILYAFLKKEGVLNEFVTEYCEYRGWNIHWLSSEPIPKHIIFLGRVEGLFLGIQVKRGLNFGEKYPING